MINQNDRNIIIIKLSFTKNQVIFICGSMEAIINFLISINKKIKRELRRYKQDFTANELEEVYKNYKDKYLSIAKDRFIHKLKIEELTKKYDYSNTHVTRILKIATDILIKNKSI